MDEKTMEPNRMEDKKNAEYLTSGWTMLLRSLQDQSERFCLGWKGELFLQSYEDIATARDVIQDPEVKEKIVPATIVPWPPTRHLSSEPWIYAH